MRTKRGVFFVMKNRLFKASIFALSLSMLAPIAMQMNTNIVMAEEASSMTAEQFDNEVASLPDDPETLTTEEKQKVANLMVEYQNMQMAEKLSIKNYSKLEKLANLKGTDSSQKTIAEQLADQKAEKEKGNEPTTNNTASTTAQESKEGNAAVLAKATEYTLEYDPQNPVSVIIRFVTDEDGDGKTDIPSRIVLIAPNGDSLPISKAAVMMKDKGTSLNSSLTWTDDYLQIDFATAMEGNWSIQTSIPVTFTKKAYAGSKEEIVAQEDQKQENKQENNQKQEQPATDDSEEEGIPMGGLLLLVALLGGIFGFTKWNSRKNNAQSTTKKTQTVEEDDDDEYGYVDEVESSDDDAFFNDFDSGEAEKLNVDSISVPSLNTDIKYDDPTPENTEIDDDPAIYSEGETSLLTAKMNKSKVVDDGDDLD